jgi:hypothetical protein
MLYLVTDPRYTLFVKPQPREPAREDLVPPEWGDFDLIMRGPPDACEVVVPALN